MLTFAGAIFFILIFALIFNFSFRKFNNILDVELIDNKTDRSFVHVIVFFFSMVVTLVSLLVITLVMTSFYDTTDDYRTIYSNDLKATVTFKTGFNGDEFIGGKKIEDTTNDTSGTLTLSKDGIKVNKHINYAEYLGDIEEGSTVEKIEYSNSLQESKLFGITLITQKSDRLKIHLKKPTSEYAKEKKDAETKKELKSLLESSK